MSLIQHMTSIWVASFILNVKCTQVTCPLLGPGAPGSKESSRSLPWTVACWGTDVLSSFPSSHPLPGVRWVEMVIWLGNEVSNFTLLSTAGLFPSLLQNQDAAHSLYCDHSECGIYYSPHCPSNQTEKSRLQDHKSGKIGKCSLSPSCSVFPITCSSLEDESFLFLVDTNVGGTALVLNKRPEPSSLSNLATCVPHTFLPKQGDHWQWTVQRFTKIRVLDDVQHSTGAKTDTEGAPPQLSAYFAKVKTIPILINFLKSVLSHALWQTSRAQKTVTPGQKRWIRNKFSSYRNTTVC